MKSFNGFGIILVAIFCLSVINCDILDADARDLNDHGEIGIAQRFIRQSSNPQKNGKEPLSLLELILVLMAKHGQAQTSAAFSALDSKPLGEVMRLLIVEVDKPLAADIVQMQQYAQNSDKQLVAVIARIVTGDATVAKDVFSWDDKLRKFPWWVRIRQRMFQNLDKFVADFKPEIDNASTVNVPAQEAIASQTQTTIKS